MVQSQTILKIYIAEHFAKYFASVTVDKVKNHFGVHLSHTCTSCELNDQSIFIYAGTPDEIRQIISELKNKQAFGPDGLSTKYVKYACDFIIEPLCTLINASFQLGVFPSVLNPPYTHEYVGRAPSW